jgi:hypothetical protein
LDRGLAAMLLRGELLTVLAADSARVFALDGLSGKVKWAGRSELFADATYVLGATEEEVVLMGESVYWLDASTGNPKACYPERWVIAGQDRLDPHNVYGRGIWAGDSVWYPARDAVMEIKLDSNRKVLVKSALPLPERPTPFGNLAWEAGRLYWAATDCVLAWDAPQVSPSKKKPLGAAK